jgi:hypothetical protein
VGWNFAWNRVFRFSHLFWLFLIFFFFRNSRFPARSVFVINVSLFTSVVCYCQHGLRRKHGKCSLCNEWWHSFMNQRQRLNHLVLLRNCIKIIENLNTRFHAKFQPAFWIRYTLFKTWPWPILARANMGLDFVSGQYGCLFSRCRKYVINGLIHGHFHIDHIIPRPILALDSVSGQYGGLGMITRPIWKCPCINL